MSTLLLERAVPSAEEGHGSRPLVESRLDGASGAHGRLTLDDLIVGVWEDLAVRAAGRCPMCRGAMLADADGLADGDALGGRCKDCGTHLS